jgi:hypothetical protein
LEKVKIYIPIKQASGGMGSINNIAVAGHRIIGAWEKYV